MVTNLGLPSRFTRFTRFSNSTSLTEFYRFSVEMALFDPDEGDVARDIIPDLTCRHNDFNSTLSYRPGDNPSLLLTPTHSPSVPGGSGRLPRGAPTPISIPLSHLFGVICSPDRSKLRVGYVSTDTPEPSFTIHELDILPTSQTDTFHFTSFLTHLLFSSSQTSPTTPTTTKTPPTPTPRRMHIIINPTSGRCQSLDLFTTRIRPILDFLSECSPGGKSFSYGVSVTRERGEATEIVRRMKFGCGSEGEDGDESEDESEGLRRRPVGVDEFESESEMDSLSEDEEDTGVTVFEGVTEIGIVGGDGTVNEVIAGLVRNTSFEDDDDDDDTNELSDDDSLSIVSSAISRIPIGVFPAGSGNGLSLAVGTRLSVELAALCIAKGTYVPLDICSVFAPSCPSPSPSPTTTTTTSPSSSSSSSSSASSSPQTPPRGRRYESFLFTNFGATADVNCEFQWLKCLGPAKFFVASMFCLIRRKGYPMELRLVCRGKEVDEGYGEVEVQQRCVERESAWRRRMGRTGRRRSEEEEEKEEEEEEGEEETEKEKEQHQRHHCPRVDCQVLRKFFPEEWGEIHRSSSGVEVVEVVVEEDDDADDVVVVNVQQPSETEEEEPHVVVEIEKGSSTPVEDLTDADADADADADDLQDLRLVEFSETVFHLSITNFRMGTVDIVLSPLACYNDGQFDFCHAPPYSHCRLMKFFNLLMDKNDRLAPLQYPDLIPYGRLVAYAIKCLSDTNLSLDGETVRVPAGGTLLAEVHKGLARVFAMPGSEG